MPYKVLYRKYRPKDFNDLYGQDNIKKLLIEALVNNKIAHAYIFSGPRGTGKTSTAKLFAKAINCEKTNNGIPCGKCSACLNYDESPDIIEIDAASNNGVDEIRELRDNVKILPTFSKYKIYIIDEVHMLSQNAWNAFLKTLEEPPRHVIFILATTELQKVPITVLSRCQRYSFQKITKNIIADNIKNISLKENINITDEAACYLAELADGGMRDALSYLDQLSKETTEISVDTIKKCFGMIDTSLINKLLESVACGNTELVIDIFDELESDGIDSNILISKIIAALYQDEINLLCKKNSIFDSIDKIKKMSFDISNCYSKKDALFLIKISIMSQITQKETSKIISREIISNNSEPNNAKKVEDIIKINKKVVENNNNDDDLIELIKIRINNSFVNAQKKYKTNLEKNWKNFKEQIRFTNQEIYSVIEDVIVDVVSDRNILFSVEHKSNSILFNNLIESIEKKYFEITKENYKMICISDEEWKYERDKYLKRTNDYIYLEENQYNKKKINKILDKAKDLFDENLIETK